MPLYISYSPSFPLPFPYGDYRCRLFYSLVFFFVRPALACPVPPLLVILSCCEMDVEPDSVVLDIFTRYISIFTVIAPDPDHWMTTRS